MRMIIIYMRNCSYLRRLKFDRLFYLAVISKQEIVRHARHKIQWLFINERLINLPDN